MSFEDFLAKLDPKVAKALKTAEETERIVLPLASEGLNTALGGGIGGGRISMVFGAWSTGKSALLMQSIGIWQKMGKICAWVDVEGTYDKAWGARLGINNDELILISAKSSGAVEREIKPLLQSDIDVIVIDSISDIMPEVFTNDDGGSLEQDKRKQMGAHAKAITALCAGILYENRKTAVVLISQVTTEIGQGYVKMIPHGGKKTLHACTQIVKLMTKSDSPINDKVQRGEMLVDERVGTNVEFIVDKNKMAPPGRKGSYDFYFEGPEVGIDAIAEIVALAIKYGVIAKGGAWYRYGEDKWQGEATVVKALKNDTELAALVKKELHTVMTGEVTDDE